MTVEEITQTLQTVAENQAKHAELHSRHIADIAEIDRMIAASLESQNRYDEQLARLFEVVGDLADSQLKNEERFAKLAEAQRRLEGNCELLEAFVRESRNETRDYFAETDKKLATLAVVHAETAELLAEFVKETNGRFVETDGQIKALIAAQARTDEQIRHLLERNGKPMAKAKKPAAKKSAKKGARAK